MGRNRPSIRIFQASSVLSAVLNGAERADRENGANMLLSTLFGIDLVPHRVLGRRPSTHFSRSEELGHRDVEILFIRLCMLGILDRRDL